MARIDAAVPFLPSWFDTRIAGNDNSFGRRAMVSGFIDTIRSCANGSTINFNTVPDNSRVVRRLDCLERTRIGLGEPSLVGDMWRQGPSEMKDVVWMATSALD